MKKIKECSSNPYELISWLILARFVLIKEDEKGFGEYPPFEYLYNSHTISITVLRYNSSIESSQFELNVKNYNTLSEVVLKVLKMFDQPFNRTKVKFN